MEKGLSCEGKGVASESPRLISFSRRNEDSEDGSEGSSSPFSGLKQQKTWRSEQTSLSSNTLRRRGSVLAADTFGGKKESKRSIEIIGDGLIARIKKVAALLVERHYVANVMGLVVLFDSLMTGIDIDTRATGNTTEPLVLLCSDLCLVLYTLELALVLWVCGCSILKDWMVVLDVVIILCGYTEMLFNRLSVASELADGMGLLRVLRMARIVRIMQLLRKTRSLKELQKLVMMMATCLKALAWCFLFCFIIMTIWAMLLVEVVNPLIAPLNAESGVFAECGDECLLACRSVMRANLLLFKTVIAGDSWGQVAVPVIEAYPGTAVIFVGSLLSLVFGVLNLIVAVVVDTFAEVRESDVMNLAEEMEHAVENDKKLLERIFNRIDRERKGNLTLEDIMEGAQRDPEFQSRLRVMDIDEVDLQQLFEMIDVDGSGCIELNEFVVPFSRWAYDSKTAPRFIKYTLMHAVQQQEDLIRSLDRHFHLLHSRMGELEERLEARHQVEEKKDVFVRPKSTRGGQDSEEEVEVCHPSASTRPLRPLQTDLAVKPAVAALRESLTEALNASVAKMEAILEEELKKCAQSPDRNPNKDQIQVSDSGQKRLSQRLRSV